LIMESLNLEEARVPTARKLIRKIDDYEERIDTLIGALADPEKVSEKEELEKYLDRLNVAGDKEFAINKRQRLKAMKVRNKVKDALDGKAPETKAKPKTGTETAAQTPSGESNPKGKKTGTERKPRRQEAIAGLKSDISNLRKRLQDETNKRRQESLTKAIDFLEKRLEKVKNGKPVTSEETPPPDVQKTLKDNDAYRSIKGQIKSARTSLRNKKIIMTAKAKEDLTDLIDDLESKIRNAKGKERTNLSNAINFLKNGLKRKKKGSSFEIPQVVVNTVTVHSPDISSTIAAFQEKADDIKKNQDIINDPEAYASYDDDEPNKGSETLAQEPVGESTNWADSRAGGATKESEEVDKYIEELHKNYSSIYEKRKYGSGVINSYANVYLGKALAKDGVPGLDTVFVYTMEEFKKNHPGKTFEDFIQSGTKGSSLATFKEFGSESLNIPMVKDKGGLKASLSGNVYYDETNYKLLLDSSAGDYILVGVFLTDDGKHLYHDRNKYDKLKGLAKEHKAMYGKSYATLLRERYWGRYWWN